MKKHLILSALGAIMMASCADRFDTNYEVANPEKGKLYEYLNDYSPLKEYVNHDKYPSFKLGVGTIAADYLQGETVFGMNNSNFEEVVTGNAMKYASCVNDKGEMDFETVKNFVNEATDNGLSVYGHTLFWHEQQQPKYLNSLIADKAAPVDPDKKNTVTDYEINWNEMSGYSFWKETGDATISVESGNLVIDNPTVKTENYFVQYFLADGITLKDGGNYKVIIEAKATGEATLALGLGHWGGRTEKSLVLNETMTKYELTFNAVPTDKGNAHMMCQTGLFAGKIYVKSLKIVHEEAAVQEEPEVILSFDFENGTTTGGWGNGSTIEIMSGGHASDNCQVVNNPSSANPWEMQVAMDYAPGFEQDKVYYLHFWAKAEAMSSPNAAFQKSNGYEGRGDFPSFNLTTEWKEYTLKCAVTGPGCDRLLFNLGKSVGKIYFDDIEVYWMKPTGAIPLTPEEKKEAITNEMERWVKGMMEACDGKVHAFDLANEVVSGGGNVDGRYALQHFDNVGPEEQARNFYWVDYLGDLDYIRTAVKFARQYGPDDVKLFINDFNLESWWDANKKAESLVKWIEAWEADGVTKIDGIGSQMHINCYDDDKSMEDLKKSIEKMYEIFVESGKLIRVSEFDMGYRDWAFGTEIPTDNLTEAQHKRMADFWNWNIRTYLNKVPKEQQWGFCAWAPTDSPANSGWRPNQPLGIWDKSYYRKHTYAGFADGLQEKDYSHK